MHVRIVIPVLPSDALVEKCRHEYERAAAPGVELSFVCLAHGTSTIESEYDLALAQPDTIRRCCEAEADGADAAIIACFGDPGGLGAKEATAIPIVGEGEAGLHVASLLGTRFSIITVRQQTVPMMTAQAARVGLSGKLASVRPVEFGVMDFDLDAVPQVVEQAAAAVLDGRGRRDRDGLHRDRRGHGSADRAPARRAARRARAGGRPGAGRHRPRRALRPASLPPQQARLPHGGRPARVPLARCRDPSPPDACERTPEMPDGGLSSTTDVADFTRGTDFLSASGGGAPTEALELLNDDVERGVALRWTDLASLPDDALCVSTFFSRLDRPGVLRHRATSSGSAASRGSSSARWCRPCRSSSSTSAARSTRSSRSRSAG